MGVIAASLFLVNNTKSPTQKIESSGPGAAFLRMASTH
jgi:hypothetical protein